MSHNDITGDKIATKPASKAYRDQFDAIFGKKEEVSAHDRAVRVLQRIEDGKLKQEPKQP